MARTVAAMMRRRLLALVVSVFVIGAGIWVVTSRGSGDSGTTQTIVTAPPGSGADTVRDHPELTRGDDPGSRTIALIVDGWSAKSMPALQVPGVDGLETITVTAASPRDIAELAATSPKVLEQIAARMMTVDTEVSCDAQGCESPAGDIPLSWFSAPGRIPGLGESYRGYGITTAVWIAGFKVADTTSIISVASSQAQDGRDASAAFQFAVPGPNSSRHRIALGYAYGRPFRLQAAWLGAKDVANRPPPFAALNPPDPATVEALTVPPLAEGPAVADSGADGLGNAQLTFFSSPTTGCGGAGVCTPVPVEPDITTLSREPVKVCSTDSSLKVAGVAFAARWAVAYPEPTHQYGAWNGIDPTEFAGAGRGRGLYTGIPELVVGAQQLRVDTVVIISGSQIYTLGMRVAHDGFDTDAAINGPLDEPTITRALGDAWKLC